MTPKFVYHAKIAQLNPIKLVGRESLPVCQLVKFNVPLPRHKTLVDVLGTYLLVITYANDQITDPSGFSSC